MWFIHCLTLDDTKVGSDKKDDPREVAKQGFEALIAGKDSTIASPLKSKVLGVVSQVLPDVAATEANRKMNEPGSANQ